MASVIERIMRACGYAKLAAPQRDQERDIPGGVIETARKNCGYDNPTDAQLYYAVGFRDAGNYLASYICQHGLADGVTKALEILQTNDPDNSHLAPAMQIVKDQAEVYGPSMTVTKVDLDLGRKYGHTP